MEKDNREKFLAALLAIAEELERNGPHPDAVELERIVFSDEPFTGHVASCETCQYIIEGERKRNPFYRGGLRLPSG